VACRIVRLPEFGRPVRQITGGEGSEPWPRREARESNWASRHGCFVLRSLVELALSGMVIGLSESRCALLN
jgi:hypothetical protein